MAPGSDSVMKSLECVDFFQPIALPKGRSHEAPSNSSFGSTAVMMHVGYIPNVMIRDVTGH